MVPPIIHLVLLKSSLAYHPTPVGLPTALVFVHVKVGSGSCLCVSLWRLMASFHRFFYVEINHDQLFGVGTLAHRGLLPPFLGGLCGDHSPHRTTMTQTKRCPIFQFGSWWAHPTMPRLFRVIAYSTGSSNGEASCSSTSVLIPHQVAHLGMSLLGPEFRRDHRAPFFCKC